MARARTAPNFSSTPTRKTWNAEMHLTLQQPGPCGVAARLAMAGQDSVPETWFHVLFVPERMRLAVPLLFPPESAASQPAWISRFVHYAFLAGATWYLQACRKATCVGGPEGHTRRVCGGSLVRGILRRGKLASASQSVSESAARHDSSSLSLWNVACYQ